MRPGYKQTDVGLIPQEWNVSELRQIGNLSKGRGLLKEDIETCGAVPAIPYTALYTDFSEVVDYGLIKWFVNDVVGTIIVSEPCVLIASSSNMVANTGKASALPGTIPVAIGREVIIFRTDHSAVFFSYLLSTDPYRKRTLVLARGTTIKHLYPATFANYRVAVPPPAEQLAITEALGNVHALLAGLERLIAKKRDIKQAAMQQLLTGQTRLPGFNGEWEMKQLRQLGLFLKGSGVRRDQAQSGNLACVRYGELYTLHNEVIRTFHSRISPAVAATSTRVQAGDLLFAGSGETKVEIGKCAAIVSSLEAYAGGDIVILRLTEDDPAFFGYLLNTPTVARKKASLGQGDAVVHISAAALGSIEVLVPPDCEEQTAIATVLSDMDAELSALDARLTKTRAIKQGMMQELLTGKTRLI